MRRITFTAFLILSVFAVLALDVSCAKSRKASEKRAGEVIAYTYDSFAGGWGPGPEITRRFRELTGYTLTLVDCGDAVQAYNRALLEKDSPVADVVIGIDNYLAGKARASGILAAYRPAGAEDLIPEDLTGELGDDWLLTPYDYNHFAMVFDTASGVPEPKSVEDLAASVYRKKIILMDPRTSTPGLGFVAWTAAVLGDGYGDFWRALRPNILTMAPGWSAGFGLFTDGEAPLVISYATDTAYHVENENSARYKALLFDEGHIRQVEGCGLLKGAPNEKGAKIFMDYLITEDAQSVLPLTQWMYPANRNVVLPECYRTAAPVPARTLHADEAVVAEAVENVMRIMAE